MATRTEFTKHFHAYNMTGIRGDKSPITARQAFVIGNYPRTFSDYSTLFQEAKRDFPHLSSSDVICTHITESSCMRGFACLVFNVEPSWGRNSDYHQFVVNRKPDFSWGEDCLRDAEDDKRYQVNKNVYSWDIDNRSIGGACHPHRRVFVFGDCGRTYAGFHRMFQSIKKDLPALKASDVDLSFVTKSVSYPRRGASVLSFNVQDWMDLGPQYWKFPHNQPMHFNW